MTSDELFQEMKSAMKSHDFTKLAVIQNVRNEVHNAEIENQAKATEEDIQKAIKKVLRITQEEHNTRVKVVGPHEQRVLMLKSQIEYLNAKLPKKLTTEELTDLVKQAIADTGATSMRDMKKVLDYLHQNATGDFDNGTAAAIVKTTLA